MKAIILAAGRGSRLYPITLNKPKGLLNVGPDEETILDRLIRQLKAVGVSDILMVVGYQKESLMNHFGTSIRYRIYENFAKTNNLHTLWSVKDELDDDVIITFADLVLHQDIFDGLMKSEANITMTVDTSQVLDGTMRVLACDNRVKNITTTTPEEANGNFIGIAKFKKDGCKLLVNEMSKIIDDHYDDYYTLAVDKLARKGVTVGCFDALNSIWREIDTKDEYDELKQNYGLFDQ